MQANDCPTENNNNNNNNNNQEQIFLSHFDQFSISFIYTGPVIRRIQRILGATKHYQRWPNLKAVGLPKIIVGTLMLEKILSINVLKLFFTLVSCSVWGRK